MDPSTQDLIDHFRRKFPMSDLLIRYDSQRNEWFVHAMSPGFVDWMKTTMVDYAPAHFSVWHPSLKTALMDTITGYTSEIRR